MRHLVVCSSTIGQSWNDKTHTRAQRLSPWSDCLESLSSLRERGIDCFFCILSPELLFLEHRAPAQPFPCLSLCLLLTESIWTCSMVRLSSSDPSLTSQASWKLHGSWNHISVFLAVHWSSYGTMCSGASHRWIATGLTCVSFRVSSWWWEMKVFGGPSCFMVLGVESNVVAYLARTLWEHNFVAT